MRGITKATLLFLLAIFAAVALVQLIEPRSRGFADTDSVTVAAKVKTQDPAAAGTYRSPLQLAISPDGKRLYTANSTANSISVIDAASGQVAGEIAVGAGPEGIALSPDGRTIFTANRLDNTVSIVDAASGKVTRTIAVANGPYDLIVGAGGTAYVTCVDKDEVVQVIDGKTYAVTRTIAVDQNPRHLAISTDGKTLLVTCDVYDTTRYINLIDLASGKVRQRVPLEMSSNLRGIVMPKPDVALVAHLNPNPFAPLTQVQQGWVNTNALSFVFLSGEEPRRVTLLLDEFTRYWSNPHDIALTPDGKLAYVTCGGADHVLVIDIAKALALIEKTPAAARPALRSKLGLSPQFVVARIAVGSNPYGIVMAPDGRRVFVANRLGDSISVIDTATRRTLSEAPLGQSSSIDPLRRGEILFHSAAICFQGQFSCASCHPEGHTSGLSWDLEDDGLGNPKNIKSFRGVKGTGPFRWQGEALTIGTEECGPTVSGAMRGQPLTDSDLAMLEAFVTAIPLLPNPHLGPEGELSEAAQRGRTIFEGKANCKKCHTGDALTNGRRRFVGTGRGRPDKLKLATGKSVFPTQFDVPRLLGAWDSGPYLHDGRAKTLHEVFTKHNPEDKHGKTTKLNKQELDDLVEYLKSL